MSVSWFIRRRKVTVPRGEVRARRFPGAAAEHPQRRNLRLRVVMGHRRSPKLGGGVS